MSHGTDESRLYEVGVLFVHGIGKQPEGDTLLRFGEPFIAGVHDVVKARSQTTPPPSYPDVNHITLKGAGAPAHSTITVHYDDGKNNDPAANTSGHAKSDWLLAEGWWGSSFPAPDFLDVARWAFQHVPWTIVSHLDTRFRRFGYATFKQESSKLSVPHARPNGLGIFLRALRSFVHLFVGLFLLPVVFIFLSTIQLLALIPSDNVKKLIGSIQIIFSTLIGDCFAFTEQQLTRSAIVQKVTDAFNWLSHRCKRVEVIAHSQGGAVAHHVLKNVQLRADDRLSTFGSGLRKLKEIERVRHQHNYEKARGWIWLISFVMLAWAFAILYFVRCGQNYGSPSPLLDVLFAFSGVAIAGSVYVSFHLKQSQGDTSAAEAVSVARFTRKKLPAIYFALVSFTFVAIAIFVIANKYLPNYFVLHMYFGQSALAYLVYFGLDRWRALAGHHISASEQEEAEKEQFEQEFALPVNIFWEDYFALNDPVSNGRLVDVYQHGHHYSSAVDNYNSAIRDHTSYWGNRDGFVRTVADSIVEKLPGRDPKYSAFEFVLRRMRRVKTLSLVRTVVIACACALFVNAVSWEDSWMDKVFFDYFGLATLNSSITPEDINEQCQSTGVISFLKNFTPAGIKQYFVCNMQGAIALERYPSALLASLLFFALTYLVVTIVWGIWNSLESRNEEICTKVSWLERGCYGWGCVVVLIAAWLLTNSWLLFFTLALVALIAAALTNYDQFGILWVRNLVSYDTGAYAVQVKMRAIFSSARELKKTNKVLALTQFEEALQLAKDINERYFQRQIANEMKDCIVDNDEMFKIDKLLVKLGDEDAVVRVASHYLNESNINEAERVFDDAISSAKYKGNLYLRKSECLMGEYATVIDHRFRDEAIPKSKIPEIRKQIAKEALRQGVIEKHPWCASQLAHLYRMEAEDAYDAVKTKTFMQKARDCYIDAFRLGKTSAWHDVVYTATQLNDVELAMKYALLGGQLGEKWAYLRLAKLTLEHHQDCDLAKKYLELELNRHPQGPVAEVVKVLAAIESGNITCASARTPQQESRILTAGERAFELGRHVQRLNTMADEETDNYAIEAYQDAVELCREHLATIRNKEDTLSQSVSESLRRCKYRAAVNLLPLYVKYKKLEEAKSLLNVAGIAWMPEVVDLAKLQALDDMPGALDLCERAFMGGNNEAFIQYLKWCSDKSKASALLIKLCVESPGSRERVVQFLEKANLSHQFRDVIDS